MESHISQALSVSAVARFLYNLISQNLEPVWVRGEISNLKIQTNGNSYFSIKDTDSKLNAILMGTSRAKKHLHSLKNGLEILIFGRISYYKKEGTITIFVEDVEFLGEGLLKQKYDELKKKLESEGMFAREHKKKIPSFPQTVGVITSPSGAAIQDILNVTKRRFGSVHIIIFPASVQGDCAADEIAQAIKIADKYASDSIDVLIIGRGGGSIEDLWCFNEEVVARAIYNCSIPTISAVGHEIDYTIADYVADIRAPTPSAAAELVVRDRKEILRYINTLTERVERLFQKLIEQAEQFLKNFGPDYFKKTIQNILSEKQMVLDNLKLRFYNNLDKHIESRKNRLKLYQEKLEALQPANILKRGYSVTYCYREDGTKFNINKAGETKKGDKIETLLAEGTILSRVEIN